jgi:N-hydroxyarylamine O-acetyltransferase
VPFENLDIHLGRPLDLATDALYTKVVDQGRGGFCYELNGLFARLLTSLGFDVDLVSSRVWMPDGSLSPPLDHLALLVHLADTWLVDVGFGDTFTIPHRLGEEWPEAGRRFRTVPIDDGWRLEVDTGDGWNPSYDLDPTPRRLEEFHPRCLWQQTAPESFFARMPLVTQATPAGRTTILGDLLSITTDGERVDHAVADLGGLADAGTGHFDTTIVDQLRLLDRQE